MRSFSADMTLYERWLRGRCEVVEAALDAKHERMRRSAFDFLRATYFRWARTIESTCPGFSLAPRVLCVGDIHIENFGTWRDADGREVWGVNDFDEAASMPYVFDLVRLVTSAQLAPALDTTPTKVANAALRGYARGLGAPRPMLLDQGPAWFRSIVAELDDTAAEFWREVENYEDATPPRKVAKALRVSLPKGAEVRRFATRRKGGGSLGRPRFLVIAEWQGGTIVREAKAMVPAAWEWAHAQPDAKLRFLDVAYGVHRSPDPTLTMAEGYLLRRVAVDARKLDVGDVAGRGLDIVLIEAMGADLGAVHAAHRRAPKVLSDLQERTQREPRWLHVAAEAAKEATRADFLAFRKRGKKPD